VREAIDRWVLYATEIEADLLPGINIHDWHRGTLDEHGALKLSSRRLLILLAKKLPENGAYKTALRGGYISTAELVPQETYNEIARLRAAYYRVTGGEESVYEPFQFVEPVARLQQAIDEAVEDEEAEGDTEQMYDDMGFS
jgi:hypothetical protein